MAIPERSNQWLKWSIAVYALAAWFSGGYFSFDEHFQLLEFAGYRLGLTPAEALPWEHAARIRPSLQPAIVIGLWQLLDVIGLADPFAIVTFLRFVSGGLALWAGWQLVRLYEPEINHQPLRQWLAPLVLLCWLGVFVHVRYSSENWSGLFFLLGYCALLSTAEGRAGRYAAAGLLLGLSFVFRYQAAFLIAGLGLWLALARRDAPGKLAAMALAGLATVAIGVAVDRWYYGEWTFTAWRYFEQNLIEGKAAEYGVSPWWYYFGAVFVALIPPFSLVYLAGWALVNRYNVRNPMVWATLPFLVVHSLIGHKEGRFLFPIVAFAPVFAIYGLELWARRRPGFIAWINGLWGRRLSRAFWYVNLAALAVVCLKAPDDQHAVHRYLYRHQPEPATLYLIEGEANATFANAWYYRRPGLVLKEIAAPEAIPAGVAGPQLLMTSNPRLARELDGRYERVFASFPDWIRLFNFNGWLDRTPFWRIYRLN